MELTPIRPENIPVRNNPHAYKIVELTITESDMISELNMLYPHASKENTDVVRYNWMLFDNTTELINSLSAAVRLIHDDVTGVSDYTQNEDNDGDEPPGLYDEVDFITQELHDEMANIFAYSQLNRLDYFSAVIMFAEVISEILYDTTNLTDVVRVIKIDSSFIVYFKG